MTPSGLISFLLALRRGLPAAGAHYRLAQVKPWIHLRLSYQLPLHRTPTSQKKEARPAADMLSGWAEPVITPEHGWSQVSFFHSLCKDSGSGLGLICGRLRGDSLTEQVQRRRKVRWYFLYKQWLHSCNLGLIPLALNLSSTKWRF